MGTRAGQAPSLLSPFSVVFFFRCTPTVLPSRATPVLSYGSQTRAASSRRRLRLSTQCLREQKAPAAADLQEALPCVFVAARAHTHSAPTLSLQGHPPEPSFLALREA